MDFSLATNFDDRLLEGLEGLPVREVFGKLPRDIVGGGRASYMLGRLSRRRLAAHVAAASRRGIRFNYLLNAACLGNQEFNRRFERRFRVLLDWLAQIGVGAVTVALPSLLEVVKRRYPHLYVRVGVFARVDAVAKARAWEDLGADGITLDPLAVNRNFDLLDAIRQAVRCDLQLIPNSDCLQGCFLSSYHMVALTHASQAGRSPFMLDYCLLACTALKLLNPVNYTRGIWIRPEDLRRYEVMGYQQFKILERNAPTEVLVNRARAYANRRYDGNLLDLIQPFGYQEPPARPYHGWGLLWDPRYLLNFPARGKVLLALRRLAEERGMLRPKAAPGVWIDNRGLEGFLDGMPREGCSARDCITCGYCEAWAQRAVRIDPGYGDRCLALYREIWDRMGWRGAMGLLGAGGRALKGTGASGGARS